MKRVIIVNTHVPFITGGVEILADGLRKALIDSGHMVELIRIPFKWYPPEQIPEHILACRLISLTESCGESIDQLIGLKFPVYYIKHPNKILWIAHQHRQVYELWNTTFGDIPNTLEGLKIREIVFNSDNNFLPEAQKLFTISQNVSNRLKKFNNIDSIPLYPPLDHNEKFYCGDFDDYVYYPSRLGPLKRQDLAIESMKFTKTDVGLILTGQPENAAFLELLKRKVNKYGLQKKVVFTYGISEAKKIALYANAIGVLFIPYDEDYGYITLEAMHSRKPVITCTDSGGPLEFVDNGITGCITEPNAMQIAEILDALYLDKQKAKKMGLDGYEKILSMDISWAKVVKAIIK